MPSIRYSSRGVVLEPQTQTVRVGDEVHRPEPKVFELLSYLMRNPGRIVSKGELLDALWSNEVVGESVLTRCVSCARKLVQDDSRSPKFVRTAHGRGYEFVAPVLAETEGPASVPLRRDEVDSIAGDAPRSARADRPFVGRVGELDTLVRVIRNPRLERPKVILVSGEAGIGKTRLLEEATRRAAGVAEVHWARASETDGTPPFFVWQQCFRSIVTARSMKVVRRALGDATGGTRKLLLGLGDFGRDDSVGWDSPGTRFRTFEAVLRGLSELARQRELVVVFDDLHHADLVSLLLLRFVADQARAPFVLLGALRDGPNVDPARRAALASIATSAGSRVELRGLAQAEVAAFLAGAFDGGVATAQRLLARSGGNPFFLTMLAEELGDAGPSETPNLVVRQAVLDRLSTLPESVVEMLTLAAVFGTEFESDLVAAASGRSEAACSDELRVARDARVVVRRTGLRWAFVHDIVREVLYGELSGAALSFAHFRVSSALDARPEYREARHASTLARHAVLGKSHAGAARALDMSIRAGAHALRSFAYEEAIEHFLRSRSLLSECSDVDAATERAVLLDLGLAQVSAGEREAARHTLQLAAERAREHGAVGELAQVALNLAPGFFAIETGVYDPVLVELLREALVEVAETDPRLRALLLGRLALALYWSDTFDERVRLCEEATELAEGLGAPDVLAAVATARGFALLRPGNLDERRAVAEAALNASRRAGDHQLSMLNHLLLGAAELERGDLVASDFEAASFRALSQVTRQPQSLWIVEAQRASRLLMDGRLGEVEALSGECLVAGQRVRDHNALLTFGVHLTLVRIEQGRAADVLDSIRDYAARYPLIVGWRVLLSHALACAGETAAAEAQYESLAARRFPLPDDLNWMVSMAWLSELCHRLADGESAALLFERLAPFSERFVVVGYAGIACLGSVNRYLGLLASTSGRLDEARHYLASAVEANRRASATLPLAHTLRDYAAVLARTGDGGGSRAALGEAENLARERNLTALSQIIRSS